ncbi:MAG TPA: hypothetical protein PKK99_02770 [Bacteroidia bacterium]|nr:hypothetical protein [Bacteroidia bacterium]HNP97944.1 hypothetical protein [Bacteroidia bacterium]
MIQRSRLLILLLFVGCYLLQSRTVFAQNASSSPYSRFGIGDIQFNGFSRNTAMGGISQAMDHPYYLNLGNPASFSSISLTTYELGVNFALNELETSKIKQQNHTSSLGYFAFGFPVKLKKWGMGFGLLPYSNVGYSILDLRTNVLNIEELHTYKGSGGLNQFFFSNGIRVAKNLSAGVTASYMFGVLNQDRTVEFIDKSFYNTNVSNSTAVGWFHFNFGLQYSFDSLKVSPSDSILMFEREISLAKDSIKHLNKLIKSSKDSLSSAGIQENIVRFENSIKQAKENRSSVVNRHVKGDWSITTGFSLAPSAGLNARNSTLIYNFKYGIDNSILIRDTIVDTRSEKGTLKLPLSMGFGLAARKGSKWIMGADFNLQNWKEYSSFGQNDSLSDSWRLGAGAQFTPNDRALKSYLKTIQYRLGFHYSQTFLNLNQTQLNEMGASLGFGFPIRRVASTIQLAVEAGSRGTTDNQLIREKYIRFTLGFTLNDRWFIKPKYD